MGTADPYFANIDRIKESAQIEKRVNGVFEKLQDSSAKLSVLMTAEEGASCPTPLLLVLAELKSKAS